MERVLGIVLCGGYFYIYDEVTCIRLLQIDDAIADARDKPESIKVNGSLVTGTAAGSWNKTV